MEQRTNQISPNASPSGQTHRTHTRLRFRPRPRPHPAPVGWAVLHGQDKGIAASEGEEGATGAPWVPTVRSGVEPDLPFQKSGQVGENPKMLIIVLLRQAFNLKAKNSKAFNTWKVKILVKTQKSWSVG